MKLALGRRGAMAATVAALTAGALATGITTASATSGWTRLSTSHGVGVYSYHSGSSSKVTADLFNGDYVDIVCWKRGDNINNQGNVWYWIDNEWHVNGGYYNQAGWVYAPYVDDSNAWRTGLTECSFG
ncbi:hypothetical protein [Streptomyces sp. 3211.6]|uniref:hypothetical protein n=1 Tax=Streptomyces sp. 3211.6 TaxID=1938845 RepID=UPI000EB5852C|nr:hypothetical protein [Streptomyces sp. 3211.6]